MASSVFCCANFYLDTGTCRDAIRVCDLHIREAGGTWSAQCSWQKRSSWRETVPTRSTLFQKGTQHLDHSANREKGQSVPQVWNSAMASMMLSCSTWLAVRFLKGVQPIEAENLLPVRPLHQGELAGVNLYLNRSLSGSTVLLLAPWASNPAGSEERKRREMLKPTSLKFDG